MLLGLEHGRAPAQKIQSVAVFARKIQSVAVLFEGVTLPAPETDSEAISALACDLLRSVQYFIRNL